MPLTGNVVSKVVFIAFNMPLTGKGICKCISKLVCNGTGMPLTQSRSVIASNNVYLATFCMGNVKIDAFPLLLELVMSETNLLS
jgi:hypothetical protein